MLAKWIDWPHDECPVCGAQVEILTGCDQTNLDVLAGDDKRALPPYCFCDDIWRCTDGHTGVTFGDGEFEISLEVGGYEP